MGRSRRVSRIAAALLAGTFLGPGAARSDEKEVAVSLLEFGGSIGNLVWVSHKARGRTDSPDANRYVRLANAVKDQIEMGRASSSLVKANFNVISTTLAYASVGDPEPTSKITLGLFAWGAKKAGDALGDAVMADARTQAQSILTQGLRESGFSEVEIRAMTAEQLRSKIPDLKVGGQVLRDVLKDDPESLQRLQAQATDIATSIGVEAFTKADDAQRTADAVKKDLAKTTKIIEDYRQEVEKRLDLVQSRVSQLAQVTAEAKHRLAALQTEVGNNTKAIQTIAEISFSGWSTAQKLQAVQSGLFPDLSDKQRDALVASLQSDRKREETIAGIQRTAGDLGSLATIAGNLGLPRDVVVGLQGAQIVMNGLAQFATGNYLGTIASVTSLVGLGGPDPAAQRHAETMKYLARQFEQINRKLDNIIELQVATLDAISKLADENRKFRQEVLSQLNRIETAVLRTETAVQAVLLNEWQPCRALRTVFNGQYMIANRDVLQGLLTNPNIASHASGCYRQMVGFLDGNVKPADWSGQIIAAENFPADKIAGNPDIQAGWAAYASLKEKAFARTRDAVLGALSTAPAEPALELARLSQPVVDAPSAAKLEAVLSMPAIRGRLKQFRCNETDVLAPALVDLICYGRSPGANSAPLPERWVELLDATLIGPQARMIVDVGVALASISDLAGRTADGSFVFPEWSQFAAVTETGPTAAMRNSLEQRKSQSLLDKLRWLTEVNVLQQSITYGDYTVELATDALYDVSSNTLDTAKAPKFLEAMRRNPVLARNVVLLAMRRATEAAFGGRDQAKAGNYRETYYGLALHDFSAPRACEAGRRGGDKLAELFPKWVFEYRVTAAQAKEAPFSNCKQEYLPMSGAGAQPPETGNGAAVRLADDLYVLLPTPLTLSTGVFEIPDSLRVALAYRDKVAQIIVDRRIGEIVASQTDEAGRKLSKGAVQELAYALINEGWGWQRKKATD